MSDNFNPDFSALTEQITNFEDATPAPDVASPVASETPESPTIQGTAPQVKADTPVVSIDELDPEKDGDRLVKVKIDGQWETKPFRDVAAGYSRTSHFTRQMQDLATQRKEVEGFKQQFQALHEERAQIHAFLKNPQQLYSFLRHSNPELFDLADQPVEGDPNEIATVQQARDLVNQQNQQVQLRLQQMEAQLTEKMMGTARDLEARRETEGYIGSINETLKGIFAKHPILNKVRMAEDIIRYEVAKINPKSITEALEAFRTVAEGIVEDLQDGYQTVNKSKLATAAKLTTSRIEPPGGSGPQIQPTTNFKRADGTLDWKALKNAAAAMADNG